ncbi:hypothetical protein [Desertibaculum subflavum]|uniref:hypothetical protein n=1 Tax=Desertibaculum subflavum TaxID=2268458 RepID=UPI000E670FDE
MRHARFAQSAAVGIATLAIAMTQARAHSPGGPMASEEITGALKGMVCTSHAGARFAFTGDGHYAYDGLWKNGGHYSISRGAVTVSFNSGLERSYSISRRGDVLYMENTAVVCGPTATASR